MNKRTLTLIAAGMVAIAVAAVYAESTKMKNTGAGLQIGTTRSQKIGFWSATPTTQLVVTVGSDSATLTNLLSELIRIGIVKTN